MAGRDRISELPADILDKILGFLPIVQAARMTVLSTFWRDTWFNLTELNFDSSFFCHIKEKYSHAHSDIWTSAALYVINKVLIQHNGLIRKFVFCFQYPSRNPLKSQSFDFDQWLLFVTHKGVEEIYFSLMPKDEYRLPNCIFSCLTLRRLCLGGVFVGTVNAHFTLPNVTSLCFDNVDFDGGDLSVDVPMLNNLSFSGCDYVTDFNITAQKLHRLEIYDCRSYQLPVNLDLRFVLSLELDSSSLKRFVNGFTRRELQLKPPTLNVEYLVLSTNDELMCDNGSALIRLFQICPKLCKLDIDLMFSDDLPTLTELLHSVGQRHKMLHTLKLDSFLGRDEETLFVKGLLACFPALEKIVITHEPMIIDCDENFEINREELLHFRCASTKAEIIFKNPPVFVLD